MKYVYLTLLLIVYASPVLATDYYVRPSGGDYGDEDGSDYANAWDGFSNVNWTTVDSGNGTLWVAGEHREKVEPNADGEAGVHIIIDSYSADPGVLLGSIDGETVTWTQVTTTGDWNNDSVYHSGNNSLTTDDTGQIWYNTVSGTLGHGTKNDDDADLQSGGSCTSDWCFWYDSDDSGDSDGVSGCVYVYHSGGSPEDQADGLELQDVINIIDLNTNDADYITIQNLTLMYGNVNAVLGSDISYATVTGNTIKYGGGGYQVGVVRHGNAISFDNDCDNLTISNNTVSQWFDICICLEVFNADAETISTVTISGNTVDNCGRGIGVHTDSGGNAADSIDTITITQNTITDMMADTWQEEYGLGIELRQLEGSITNVIVSRNNISNSNYTNADDTEGHGIAVWGVVEADIYYNLIHNNDYRGLYISSAAGTDKNIYNNTIYNNGESARSDVNVTAASGDVTFTNNIIMNNNSSMFSYDTANVVADYNLYYTTRTSDVIWADAWYANVAAYHTGVTPDDDNSPASSDPLFADASNGYFLLETGSPAIDSGTNVSLTTDYPGGTVPQNGTPDIGAYEHYPNAITNSLKPSTAGIGIHI